MYKGADNMSTRELVAGMLDVLNAETIAAIEEAEQLLKDPNTKKYTSVEELFEDLNAED